MGRISTPTYRVEYQDNRQPRQIVVVNGAETIATLPGFLHWQSMCWDSKRDGKPTDANLEKWRQAYNRSFNPKGGNFHVSKAAGVIIHINRARIIHQKSSQVVATTTAPMFEVV